MTVHYPDVKRAYPDRFRGILALTYDKETGEENCIGCRLCEYICPPQVIKVEMLKAEKRNWAKTFTLELYACEFCELCVQVCPTDAIIMMKSFDLATARPPRAAARQGSAARDRARVRAVVGDRQQAARHAGAAEARQGRRQGRREGVRRVTVATVGFWAVAVVLLASSLAVVLSPNLFHSVLFLAVALVATGVVFLFLESPFLFGVQLLLYAGGVVMLVVFAIMLTERIVGQRIRQTSHGLVNGAIVSAAVFVGIVGFLVQAGPMPAPRLRSPATRRSRSRRTLLGPYAVPFELLGVLLVAALLGALYFARED